MKTQKEIFQTSEANQWFIRNSKSNQINVEEGNVITKSLQDLEISPQKALEIGCSSGIQLNILQKALGPECFGIDPSDLAIENGKKEFPNLSLQVGTADSLPFDDSSFDLIIFGFCLYLCDRKDLFKIANEADRCLSENGFLVIVDFQPPIPYKNSYTHKDGIYSFKMDYSKMFSWNPSYNIVLNRIFSHSQSSQRNNPDEKVSVTVLHKNEEFSYPIAPF
jgi:ubiquinone/menaquinone biosynthesis C-methylase UbiE